MITQAVMPAVAESINDAFAVRHDGVPEVSPPTGLQRDAWVHIAALADGDTVIGADEDARRGVRENAVALAGVLLFGTGGG